MKYYKDIIYYYKILSLGSVYWKHVYKQIKINKKNRSKDQYQIHRLT